LSTVSGASLRTVTSNPGSVYSCRGDLIGNNHGPHAGDSVQSSTTAPWRPCVALSGRSTTSSTTAAKIAHTLRSVTWCPPRRADRRLRCGRRRLLASETRFTRLRASKEHPAPRATAMTARCACAGTDRGDPNYRPSKASLVAGTEHGDDPPHPPRPAAILRGPEAFDTTHA